MAFEGEVTENKQLPPYPDKIQQPQDYAEYWTMDKVVRWLDVNDFKPAIDVFKGKFLFAPMFENGVSYFEPILTFCFPFSLSISFFPFFFYSQTYLWKSVSGH